jgi:tetratricopeptide (TPR) repeat protein
MISSPATTTPPRMRDAIRRFSRSSLLLLAIVLAGRPAIAAEWVRVETPNFVVFGEPSEKRVREVAEHFERFRQALGRILPGAATRAAVPTVVVVFETQRSFEPYRPRFNGKPIQLGGYFVSTNNQNIVALAIENRERAMRTVFHEYAHLVVANLVRDLPPWVSEGLAEYYSTFSVQNEGRVAVMGNPIPEHVVRLNTETLIPHAELLKVDHSSALYNEGERRSVFYAQSWALVHMLTMGRPDRSKELERYIALTASGVPSTDAWTKMFGGININAEIQRYVSGLTMRAIQYTFDEEIPRVGGAVTTPSAGDVEAALSDLLDHVKMSKEAGAKLEKAIALQPVSARARALLALYRLQDENRPDEAETLLVAAAEDKSDWLAQYHVATGLTHLIERTDRDSKKLVDLARQALAIVATARPELPNALVMSARISTSTGEGLDEALRDVRLARKLAPGREDYAFEEAHVQLRRREFAEARTVLGPMLSARYNESVREHARELMTQVVGIESAVKQAQERHTSERTDSPAPGVRDPNTREIILQPGFRKLLDGEQRTEGLLERVECSRRGITLHVRTGDGTTRFSAPRFEAIDFISYRDDIGQITCQPREPADPVYVTWRRPVAPAVDRIAIAVEFLPQK